MTAELKETMGRASWGPVKVKKEEDEESVIGQASGQQVCSEHIKDWAPGEGPYVSFGIPEEEEKVNDDLGRRETQTSNTSTAILLPNPDSLFLIRSLTFIPLEYSETFPSE